MAYCNFKLIQIGMYQQNENIISKHFKFQKIKEGYNNYYATTIVDAKVYIMNESNKHYVSIRFQVYPLERLGKRSDSQACCCAL